MSIRAGSILTVAGRNVVDRLQSAGLGDARIPIETIREIGNDLVVDKVPGEPDFTFTMEGLDTSVELMALLHGKIGTGTDPTAGYAGAADPDGTEYRWEDCQPLNIVSPWKRNAGSAGGNINAGLLIPGYYPTRISYRFGVTDNAGQTVELGGGSYYYAETAPVEETAVGDGVQSAFVTSESARALRLGGSGGSTFQRVFGVLVGGRYMTRGVDYVESVPGGTGAGASAVTTLTFVTPPAVGELVRFVYFTETAKAYPQAVNADAVVKPGAVRGRNIVVLVGTRGTDQVRLPGVQTVELTGTYDSEVEREMGNPEPTGRSVNGVDTTGTVTLRPKDKDALFSAFEKVTGVNRAEVFGYLNDNLVPVEIQIQNPKNPGQILKTLYVEQGKFQLPGTPARVNTATDFSMQFDSATGSFSEFKGARP
jgi:hypothetical protein